MTIGNDLAYGLVSASILAMAAPAWADCDKTQPNQTPTSRYAIAGGEVHDKTSNLIWQRCSVGQHWEDGTGCVGAVDQLTWNEAMRQASGAWRVPTRDELITLVSPSCKNPAINEEAFPGMERGKPYYWTGTSNVGYPWLVDFNRGYTHFTFNYNLANTAGVRLVRSGE